MRRSALFLALLVMGTAGCKVDPYHTGHEGHWEFPDAGIDAAPVDAAPDACVPTEEVCDERDNDCDGLIDEDFDLDNDPNNCGACGNRCEFDHAFGLCENGQCHLGDCMPGHWNNDGDESNGCEYACHQTNDGQEVCDEVDNDCDGQTDEDFDLDTDPNNCGACHRTCAFFEGVGACQGGNCVLDHCSGAYVDKDGNPDNGCECLMGVEEGDQVCDPDDPDSCDSGMVCVDRDEDGQAHCGAVPVDNCDGVDNDCDGETDEDAPTLIGNHPCYTQPTGCSQDTQTGQWSCEGQCATGIMSCVGGRIVCSQQVFPSVETCDGVDNDCDGQTDEDFDFQNDPVNCGGCNVVCSALDANTVFSCQQGNCVVAGCMPGYWNADGIDSNGCEYQCSLTNGGVEACGDSVDNDCDGETDEGFDFQNDPANCGSCGNDCSTGVPFGTQLVGCQSGVCQYECRSGYVDLNGDVDQGRSGNGCEYSCVASNGGTEVCDSIDNDCDGQTDEGFDRQTSPDNCGSCGYVCSDHVGLHEQVVGCSGGVCQFACVAGYVDLDGDMAQGDSGNGCEYGCSVTNGGVEICDGNDNDCDGATDEDAAGQPLTQACYTGPAGTEGQGICRGGTQTCTNGAFGSCSGEVTPGTESCNGQDDDCDGATDEDAAGQPLTQACYTGPAGTEGEGTCHGGTQTCTNGIFGGCSGQVTPASETCDNLDNDCDGATDEDFDKQGDLLNCGGCGYRCTDHVGPDSYATGCSSGVCQFACRSGHVDLNGDVAQGDGGNGCEYACTVTNGGVEACGDNVDNDCDGQTDEGFDYQTDADNCGACGYSCLVHKPYQADSLGCSGGTCQYQCVTGYYDLNNDLSLADGGNGCEYACTVSNGGTEVCDSIDNDCDGQTDENFDKQTDVDNCGSCGYACSAHVGAHEQVVGCSGGVCQFACVAGYVDLDGDMAQGSAGNGCEYGCTQTNGGVETCDGIDNDCDGDTDENASGQPLTQACYTGPAGTEGQGVCHGGTQTCSGGGWGSCSGEVTPGSESCNGIDDDCDGATDEDAAGQPLTQACYTGPTGTEGEGTCHGGTQTCTNGIFGGCSGQVTPVTETCDSLDNDCDGATDEDFDKQGDLLNCGACGYRCTDHVGPNSYATGCSSGVCQFACQPNYHDLNGDVAQGDAGNGCEYGCSVTNGGVEACGDSVDNDCDGQTDEGFDLQTDSDNCGACGYSCEVHKPYQATSLGCSGGSCQYQCSTGYYDINGDLSLADSGNGCEYACTVSNGGTEACDDIDNDCDAQTDEDFDKQTDPANCGTCGYACSAHLGAHEQVAGCSGGVCQFACVTGYVDLDGDKAQGDAGNGCEYACTVSNGGTEACDGIDNDCDGATDENASGQPLTQACYTGPAGTEGVGTCHGGTQTCGGGTWGSCNGEVTPQSELCDLLDNDCDSATDEDFDLNTDLNNCGGCGNSCWNNVPANAFPDACNAGTCHFSCLGGFNDINGDLNTAGGNGCEYVCPVNPPGNEYCDGQDNDCDALTDESLTPPAGYCNQGTDGPSPPNPGTAGNNPCHGVVAVCEDPDGSGPLQHGWYCQYPSSVETDPNNPNILLGYERLCDGADGDCDGSADDGFGLGTECDNGELGACRVTGSVVCDSSDPSRTTCNLPDPSTWPTAQDEVCDGADNDCDGLVDENSWDNDPSKDTAGVQGYVVDDVVAVTVSGHTVWVYTFEAARPTATGSSAGTGSSSRACSKDTVVPWSYVTYKQAAQACARAGMRLCHADEWYEACNGTPGASAYPYGDTYQPTYCNGKDQDPSADEVEPTGTQLACSSTGYGIEDLSGNLREWTDDLVGQTSSGEDVYRVRGGSFIDTSTGLRCDFETSAYPASALAEHVGFRCCTTCGNGVVDPGETCDPAPPQSDTNCNPLFCGPDTCGDGNVDASEQCDDGNLLPLDGCSPQCQNE